MARTTQQYIQSAVRLLRRIPYATVATVDQSGQPWNSPVAMVYDDRLGIYWFSDKQSQHARNVRANGRVYIVIYDSTWPEGTGAQGLYLKAQAYEVADPTEVRKARQLKKESGIDDPAAFLGPAVRRVYKAVPQAAWMNDVERKGALFIRDYRVELCLEQLKLAILKA